MGVFDELFGSPSVCAARGILVILVLSQVLDSMVSFDRYGQIFIGLFLTGFRLVIHFSYTCGTVWLYFQDFDFRHVCYDRPEGRSLAEAGQISYQNDQNKQNLGTCYTHGEQSHTYFVIFYDVCVVYGCLAFAVARLFWLFSRELI